MVVDHKWLAPRMHNLEIKCDIMLRKKMNKNQLKHCQTMTITRVHTAFESLSFSTSASSSGGE